MMMLVHGVVLRFGLSDSIESIIFRAHYSVAAIHVV